MDIYDDECCRRSVRGASSRGSTRRRRPIERAHSDTDCRYRDSGYSSGRARRPRVAAQTHAPAAPQARTRSQPPPVYGRAYGAKDLDPEDVSPVQYERYGRNNYHDEQAEFPKISLPLQDLEAALKDLDDHQNKITSKSDLRSKSLPRPSKTKTDFGPRRDFDDQRHYDEEPKNMHDLSDVDFENYREKKALEERDRRFMERDDYYNVRDHGYDPEDEDVEFESPRYRRPRYDWRADRGRSEYYERDEQPPELSSRRRGRRARSAMVDPEPRWEDEFYDRRYDPTPHRLRRLQTVEDTARSYRHYTPSPDQDDWSDEVVAMPRRNRQPGWGSRQSEIYAIEAPVKEEIKPVPIWLCVFLVASYIVAGTFLFKRWESWEYLDAAYFCFITLTTIGFGDFVPAQGQNMEDSAAAVHSIALCSLYLLFGIALLAMSFNLVQEEVRANVAALATRLGIIKPRETDTDPEY
ncbi:hypothetical protein evm_013153 [Chilo suppressalis]|nr:hypothetical protein evm_013153 [Chilo suppressalis]